MRIGYSCHDAFPSTDTNTQQIFWTLREAARLGCEIDLIVPAVEGGSEARTMIAAHYGVRGQALPRALNIIALGSHPPTTSLGRGWFDWRVVRALAAGRYHLVWTRDAVAAAACVRAGLPTVFETYRPDLASSPVFALWRGAVLNRSNLLAVIAHSRLAADTFARAGLAPDRCLVAHNGFAPSLMNPALTRDEARVRVGLPRDERLVVYAGHVGRNKGTDALLRFAARLREARVVIVGGGVWAGASNVISIPRVPLADVSTYLYAADCLIVPPTDAPLRRYRRTVLPMKLFSYLAAGRPIVAPKLPDIEEVLVDGETARLVPADDMDAAARATGALLADHELQRRLSVNAKALSREFTWEARARQIVTFLGQVT